MKRRAFQLATALAMLSPTLAQAHLVTTGMGPVYDGIGHLLLTPEDLVPVVALSLYAGLRGATAGRWIMLLLPLAWFVGGIIGAMISITPPFPVPAISLLLFGILVAADLHLPAPVVSGLAILLGLVHGFFNGAALHQGAGTLGLLGITAMLFVIATIASAFVVSLRRPWTRIAVRVIGSWIAASGLLLLGWALHHP